MPTDTPRDPTIPPQRETLTPRKRQAPAVTLPDMVAMDVENLLELPGFRRFVFTVLESCGMYSGSFHSEAAFLAYAEGRRSLGLDILRTLTTVSADAHIRIMQEAQPFQEKQNGRRKHYDRNIDGDDGDPDDVD